MPVKTGPGSAKKKRKTTAGSSSVAPTEVPAEVMTSSEAEKFHSRLESAAKQLRLNRTQVIIVD